MDRKGIRGGLLSGDVLMNGTFLHFVVSMPASSKSVAQEALSERGVIAVGHFPALGIAPPSELVEPALDSRAGRAVEQWRR